MRANAVNLATFTNALCHRNAMPLIKRKWGSVWAEDFSLSLSLSRCSHFWHTKIFKCFVFGLLRPFCHFEPLQKGDPTGCKAQAAAKKSTQIKRKLAIFGYFACAQYDKFRQKPKFDSLPHFNVIKARNDGGFCHFEPFAKRRKIQRIESTFAILGYFACAQYDKFGLLLKNNGYFHSNFRDKIYKFYSFLWIATLALLARNDGKAKIQIFYSKFKAFHKFNSFCKFKAFYKFNSFYNFISNFKPYTRLFHIFTPSFRSVQTDKKFFTRRTLCLNRNF